MNRKEAYIPRTYDGICIHCFYPGARYPVFFSNKEVRQHYLS